MYEWMINSLVATRSFSGLTGHFGGGPRHRPDEIMKSLSCSVKMDCGSLQAILTRLRSLGLLTAAAPPIYQRRTKQRRTQWMEPGSMLSLWTQVALSRCVVRRGDREGATPWFLQRDKRPQ